VLNLGFNYGICSPLIISVFLVSLVILIRVAFFIVTERKGLGILQLRQGPNKVGLKGLVQFLADGVKLFTKEIIIPLFAREGLYTVGPLICFFCAYSLWVLFPIIFSSLKITLGLLFFLCVSSAAVYGVFMVG
jgi:NADH-quinone oxidoreductase subunit H